MTPFARFEELEKVSPDNLRTMFISSWWAGEVLALRLADLAAAFARIDAAAAQESLVALRELMQRDLGAQRDKLTEAGVPTGPITAIQGRMDDALNAAEDAVREASKALH